MNVAAEPRFLVVDDDPTMRRVMRALLKEIGFERVESAENGVLALQMLRASRFECVISDIRMPDMGGFELLSAMRGDADLKDLPVLMVTAESSEPDIARAASEASAYIVRPFTLAGLEERLRAAAPRLFGFR